MSAILRSQLYK